MAQANIAALQQLCENILLTLLALYEQWHGDFSEEIPRFSGIGKGGDISNVQVVRCAIDAVFSISAPELVSKMLVAFTNDDPASVERCAGQSIILSGLLSTVIQYVKDEGGRVGAG